MCWLEAAGSLPGKALHVAVAIRFLHGFDLSSSTVRLKPSALRRLGVKKDSARRALGHLESAGLVRVDRRRGRAPIVTIIDNTLQTDAARAR